MRFLIVLFFLQISSFVAAADTLVSCNDGDTCRIKTKSGIVKVRLAGIDAPETGQEHWEESKDFLVKLLKGAELKLECNGTSYDRSVCNIFIGTTNINEEMVKAGMAWDYPQYSLSKYQSGETQARRLKVGLWKQSPKASPFCYRHETSRDCVKKNNLYEP